MSSKQSPDVQDSLVELLVQTQRRHNLFPPPWAQHQPVVVAVSGGVDSVALLHLLAQMAEIWQLELHVAHVDHALRPTSAADAAFVRDLAEQMSLPFYTTRLDAAALRAAPDGLEAAARRVRYRFLCATALNVTPAAMVPVLAVAHHADDQAETVLLRLAQGSGLRGLGAMRPVSTIDDPALTLRPVRVVRPLLAARRAEIVAYARRRDLAWREDESNQDESHPRNLVRHQVLPLLARINPQIVATLARTADLLAEEGDRLAAHDARALRESIVMQDRERILLDLARLQQMSLGEVRSVLHRALTMLDADMRAIGSQQLAALALSVSETTQRSGPHPLAGWLAWSVVALSDEGLALALHRQHALPLPPSMPWFDEASQQSGAIVVPRSGSAALGGWRLECAVLDRSQLPEDWRRNPDRWTAYIDADAVAVAVLAPPQPTQKIDPLGMAGRRKSLGDLFTDARIEPGLRRGWPVLLDVKDGRVLWVCGLAQSHATRITDATRSVWLLRWRSDAEISNHPTTEKEH
jgi:tRNA(Ile)-lysidine synthase